MMVVNNTSPVIHVLVWQAQTFVPQWHRRVPSQWVGGGGDPGAIIQEAACRKGEGDQVYWCLVTKEKLTSRRVTGSAVIVVQAYLKNGVVSLVTTDDDALLGVPPHSFESFIEKEGWGPRVL